MASDIRLIFGADQAQFDRAVSRARRRLAGLQRTASESARRVARIGVAAAAAGAAILTHLVRTGFQAIDAQAKLSRQFGTTVDGMRAMEIAAKDAGVETAVLRSGLNAMTRRLGEAADGTGEALDALDKLGLSAQKLIQMDSAEAMAEIAAKIRELPTAAERSAAAMDIFSDAGRNMVNLFMDAPEAIEAARQEIDELGLSLSAVDAARVEAANDAMSRITRVMEGVRNTITVSLAGPLKSIADRFNEAARQAGGWRDQIQDAVNTGITLLGRFVDTVGSVVSFVERNPTMAQFGLLGFVFLGKKGAAAATAFGTIVQGAKNVIDRFAGDAEARLRVLNREAESIQRGIDAAEGTIQRTEHLHERLRMIEQEKAELGEIVRQREGLQTVEEGLAHLSKEAAEGTSRFGEQLQNLGKIITDSVEPAKEKLAGVLDLPGDRGGDGSGGDRSGLTDDEREAMARELATLEQHLMNEEEKEIASHARRLEKLQEFWEARLINEEEFMQLRRELEERHQEDLGDIRERAAEREAKIVRESLRNVQQAEQMKFQAYQSTVSEAINLLNVFGRENKAAALAALAVQKGLAIAQTIISTQVASMRALAELGPIYGAPVAAAIEALGAVKVGLIAATGIAQAATMGGGGGVGGVTAQGGGQANVPAQPTAQQQRAVHVNIHGQQFSGEQLEQLVNDLNDFVGDGGRLVATRVMS